MADVLATRQAVPYHHAADLPGEVWGALSRNEPASNIILPFAKKALDFPRAAVGEQLWVVLYGNTGDIEFVLSCTRGPLGNYPIFIVACKPPVQLTEAQGGGEGLADSLPPLVTCLLEQVPSQRIFSVFSTANVARKFADICTAHGIRALDTPYYDATFTFCTAETLRTPSGTVPYFADSEDVVISLRRAEMSHLQEVKTVCLEFSKTSWPFVHDDAGAEAEAKILIDNKQAWIHLVQKSGQAPVVACLVATTRVSDNVAAVTKVFTPMEWRGKGCAARLLHRVCQVILQEKERVVLYAGNSAELAPARRVYHKLGFQGLDPQERQPVQDVEKWLEIGFDDTTLGFW